MYHDNYVQRKGNYGFKLQGVATGEFLQDPVEVDTGAVKMVWPEPPPHDQVAKVARYVVHITGWFHSLIEVVKAFGDFLTV